MYLIDGHNLIPKIPGFSLGEIDDEERLIELLRIYARLRGRRDIEVFFDGAPPGFSGERAYGSLRAHFVPVGQTADEAIRRRLASLGRAARNATVVSSDRQVKAQARAVRAAGVSSEHFARELILAQREDELARASKPEKKTAPPPSVAPPPAPPPAKPARAGEMSGTELNDWLELFKVDPADADRPIEPPETRRPRKKLPPRPFHGFPQQGKPPKKRK